MNASSSEASLWPGPHQLSRSPLPSVQPCSVHSPSILVPRALPRNLLHEKLPLWVCFLRDKTKDTEFSFYITKLVMPLPCQQPALAPMAYTEGPQRTTIGGAHKGISIRRALRKPSRGDKSPDTGRFPWCKYIHRCRVQATHSLTSRLQNYWLLNKWLS